MGRQVYFPIHLAFAEASILRLHGKIKSAPPAAGMHPYKTIEIR